MRAIFISMLFALALNASPVLAAAPTPAADRLDHILLWGRDINTITADMAVKLGFQVRPGRDPSGVANRYIRLADGGFIELLGITRPNPDLDPGSRADQASLHGGPGARSFGIHSPALDQDREALQTAGYSVTPVFSASPNDPDGAGPGKPPRWRLFAFDPSPLSSGIFYIDYAPASQAPAVKADDDAVRQHPNGAKALSAIWLVSSDAKANRDRLSGMGFPHASEVKLPQIGARGYCVVVGSTSLLALEPDGPGITQDALATGGPQILGISLAVSDIAHARRLVERGYDVPLQPYPGLFGDAVLAPTRTDLGMLIEFHAGTTGPCGLARTEKP